jgi:hypothetical protein
VPLLEGPGPQMLCWAAAEAYLVLGLARVQASAAAAPQSPQDQLGRPGLSVGALLPQGWLLFSRQLGSGR